MPPEDQGHLNDIAEEGKTTLIKYAISFELDAPTTIIAIANQFNTEWNDSNSISKDEIPLLRTLIDRSDQVYAFRDAPSEQELENYTEQKTRFRKRRQHNYNFLKKLLVYARTINPKIAKGEPGKEIESRLNQFWINARLKDVATNRTYDSIFRLAEAQARLNLSDEIDDNIATQTMESISLMLLQYGRIVNAVKSPRDATYDIFLHILKESKAALSVEELHRIACGENKQIAEYFGDKSYKLRDNHKLRIIVEMLHNHSSIKQIQINPTVLQWIDGESDRSDRSDTISDKEKDNEIIKTIFDQRR